MFTPHHSSPLARTPRPRNLHLSPFPTGSALKLWDEDDRRAVENPRRETICSSSTLQTPKSTRFSSDTVLGIIKSYDPHSSPRVPCPSPPVAASPQLESGFNAHSQPPAHLVSGVDEPLCKTCKTPMTTVFGDCETCKNITSTIPSLFAADSAFPTTISTAAPTTTVSTTTNNTANTDLTSRNLRLLETAKSPEGKPRRPSMPSLHLSDLPIRLSPLRSPLRLPTSPRSPEEAARPRKSSLRSSQHNAFPCIEDAGNPGHFPAAHPSAPSTPPSASRGVAAGLSYHTPLNSPPYSLAHVRNPSEPLPTYGYASYRHMSITSTESSTLFSGVTQSPTTPTTTASTRRESQASVGLQRMISAWDDWDSDGEEEKAGLVKYWRGRRWRSSRGSLGGIGAGRRESVGSEEVEQQQRENGGGSGRKRRGFVRVISCGCVKS
ncbi:unnamed protein product [Periconia digitata]|uniref:Uncharacterized protein n=1 Tax=Periconia digitata TaxID=1303443 RepID=A0A9W4UKF2_9PLEO|nr:unnamed protein product [Periconia digitata]